MPAIRIAELIVGNHTGKGLAWLMALAAFVIGIPMFFEVGLVILLPLIFTVARKVERLGDVKGSPYVFIGVPVIAGLATLHGMVPPHPGPLTAVASFHADLGKTMVYGFICAVPAIILGGPVYANLIAPHMTVRPDAALLDQFTSGTKTPNDSQDEAPRTVPAATALLGILLPVLLMLSNTLAETFLPDGSTASKVTAFIGAPVMAMLIGLLVALVTLGYARGIDTQRLRDSLGSSLKPIAGILLIIAGGGAFNHVLVASHVGDAIVHMVQGLSISAIAFGWLVAALLSVSTGSATVGIVGAAGLLTPLLAADPSINASLLVVAVGSGSLFFNYANHAGFWLVKESFGMTMGETFKTITVVQSIVGLCGLGMALLLDMLPAL